MGTTESIFYDDNDDDHHVDEGYGQQQQQKQHPAAPYKSTPTLARRRPADDDSSGPSPRPTPSRRIISHTTPGSSSSKQGVLFQLSGTVLGLAESGKHTLLQRLEGKEPDFTRRRRRDSEMESSSRSRASQEESNTSSTASAPYQVPPNVVTWDSRIWLEVAAQQKLSKKSDNSSNGRDFYVLLVDPRKKRNKLEKHVNKSIRSILRAQGYGGDTAADQQKRPFCLCILRNFRDKLNDDDDDKFVSESDLTTWTMQVLEGYPDLDPSAMVLQCEDVSLLNCYGLGQLHYFIYQSYVLRKRYDVERQLQQVVEAQSEARHQAPPSVSYQEYCEEIEQLVHGSPTSRRRDDETATTATTSSGPGRRQIVMVSQQQGRRRTFSGESSSTLPSTQQSLVNPKDALEAFLESDSEVESVRVVEQSNNDESDRDDEFFLDGTRNRRDECETETTNAASREASSQMTKPVNDSKIDDGNGPDSELDEGGEPPPAAETNSGVNDDTPSLKDTGKTSKENKSSKDGKTADAVGDDHTRQTELESEIEAGGSREDIGVKNKVSTEGQPGATSDDDQPSSSIPQATVETKRDVESVSDESDLSQQATDRTKKQSASVTDEANDEEESDSEFFVGEPNQSDDSDEKHGKDVTTQQSSVKELQKNDNSNDDFTTSVNQSDNNAGEAVVEGTRYQHGDDGDADETKAPQRPRVTNEKLSRESTMMPNDDLEDTAKQSSEQPGADKEKADKAVETDSSQCTSRAPKAIVTSTAASIPDATTATKSELSAAALAALAAAEQSFEQMFQNKEERPKKSKKKKEDGEKKKRKKEKQSKQKEEE